jgi:hypothetical protein
MKKISFFAVAATLFGTLLLTSCAEENEPEPVDPGNTDPRAKFNGLWSLSENSQDFGTSTYNVTIADSSNASYILMSYLYGFTVKTYATVSGNNLTIPVQLISGNNVSGNGTLVSATQLNMTYYVQSTATHTDTVTAVLTK